MDKLNILEDIRLPNTSLEVTIRTCRATLALAPDISSEAVETMAARLDAQVGLTEGVMTTRLREADPQLLSTFPVFDRFTDVAWVTTDQRLGDYAVYEHEGIELLPPSLAEQVEVDQLRERAAAATKLRGRLFGTGGLEFLRLPFLEQAEAMATILRLIDEDGLAEQLDELVGPALPRLLRACQVHYEALLDTRLSRQRGVIEDLRKHRNRLRRLLHRYRNTLVAWVDEDEPESVEIAWTALQPLVTVRACLTSPRRPSDDELIELLDAMSDPLEPEPEPDIEPVDDQG